MSKPNQEGNASAEVESVGSITPHNRALYEAGKTWLIESMNTGREFCKFMIGAATGAIPIYLALLKFILPEKFALTFLQGLIALIPSILFLLSAVIFAVGYFPERAYLSLDLIREIERERTRTINRRRRISIIGFALFCVSIIFGISVTMLALVFGSRLSTS